MVKGIVLMEFILVNNKLINLDTLEVKVVEDDAYIFQLIENGSIESSVPTFEEHEKVKEVL